MGLTRRRLLASAGAAGAVAAAAPWLGARALQADYRTAPFRFFTEAEGRTLERLVATLVPHSWGEARWTATAEHLDATVGAGTPAAQKLYLEGIRTLDEAAGRASAGATFASLSPSSRQDVVRSLEGTPFLQAVYGATIGYFYSQPAVWRQIGYPGPSARHGGYLNAGFDRLDW